MKTNGAIARERSQWRVLALTFAIALPVTGVQSAWGVNPTSHDNEHHDVQTLKFGMSTALSGPAGELGIHMRHGILAAFAEATTQKVFPGKRLDLIALDDGYEPARTALNMHQLTEVHQVLTVIGNVGTPTAITAIPIAQKTQTPFFGAFTGASLLRREPLPNCVINYRASYAEETAAIVDALVAKGIRPEEIGFFTQNDSFGDDGFFGGLAAIRRHQTIKISSVPHGRYRRNTSQVEDGLADLLMHHPTPKAVIMVGSYEPCSKLIRLARQNDFNPQFLAISFVGSDALQQSLGEMADGIVATQVVPHFNRDLPLVCEYRDAMQTYDSEIPLSFVSLEGYTVGRILIKAVASIRVEISRPAILEAFEQLGQFDIGLGSPLTLGPNDHQASNRVWPVMLKADGSESLSWEELPSE
ncbi:Extracellular ligand-binding receptor [Rhodopirellula islandica]|uniref:Extracellular ligand-binding receptor n=1 Tax=Rhodopirellula islandica TaxID=595434 RepID=A0A0J1BHB8_RHOIS|nr:ABC transporter substrate-binding protein [Rhodopirellula islandica]KLU05927.1 Extracellular ligand-binding receptor [Rhodopirellula islandica]